MDGWEKMPPGSGREIFCLDVPEIGDRLEITIVPPALRDPAASVPLPAIYVLDPFPLIDILAGTKLLFDLFSGGTIPAAYIVGIGYASRDVAARRFRDFTSSPGRLLPDLPLDLTLGTSGASRFVDCIRERIIPGVESRYRLDPSQRMLIGYSLGGLFACTLLLTHPGIFARTLVISPSLWWDEEAILRDEAVWAEQHADLPAKVAFVCGSDEESPGGGWENNLAEAVMARLAIVTRLQTLHERLRARAYPGLRQSFRLTPEGRHITHLPNALALGLIDAFGL